MFYKTFAQSLILFLLIFNYTAGENRVGDKIDRVEDKSERIGKNG